MTVRPNQSIATDIWRDQIERPEQVDAALSDVEKAIGFLRGKKRLLKKLRALSVGVYGDPYIDVEIGSDDPLDPFPPTPEPDPFEPILPPESTPDPLDDPFDPPFEEIPDPDDVPPTPDDVLPSQAVDYSPVAGAPWHGYPPTHREAPPRRGINLVTSRPVPDDDNSGYPGGADKLAKTGKKIGRRVHNGKVVED